MKKHRAVRNIAALFAFAIIIRLLSAAGTEKALRSVLERLGTSEAVTALALKSQAVYLSAPAPESPSPPPSAYPEESASEKISEPEVVKPKASGAATRNILVYNPEPEPKEVPQQPGVENYGGISILNKTEYIPDIKTLLSENPGFTVPAQGPQILIIHTHGSEAYECDGSYVESDPSRTQDKEHSVIRVGDVLSESLSSLGFFVLHDRSVYDYPSYSGSYSRSLSSVSSALEQYPELTVVIDIHRDSITLADGSLWRSSYDEKTAQVMLIVTNGENGLAHPDWLSNFRFALRLQSFLDAEYPGLARPLLLSPERYNQNAAPGYLLIEVGSDGNTLSEAEEAARLLSVALASVLRGLIPS